MNILKMAAIIERDGNSVNILVRNQHCQADQAQEVGHRLPATPRLQRSRDAIIGTDAGRRIYSAGRSGTLRVSVTDRCNLRCAYCMPETEYVWLPRADLLTFEEIDRLASIFVSWARSGCASPAASRCCAAIWPAS